MNSKSIRSKCHERLASELREAFQTLPMGTRLESIEKLASRYEVSAVTVRLALVLLQNEGLITLRHGSGSYVSRPDAERPKRHIAILTEMNLLRAPRNVFHGHIMDELRLFLKAQGHPSRLYIGHVGSEQPDAEHLTCTDFTDDLALDRIEGVAALATAPGFHWTERVRIRKIPIVGMGGWNPNLSGSVDPDFFRSIHSALVGLVGNGRRNPAFVGWDKQSCDHFKTVVAGLGLTLNPHWIRTSLKPDEPGAGWSDFREIWASGTDKPDSIIFGDDVLFQDALPAIESSNVQIPVELEILVMANKGVQLPQPFPYTRMDCDPAEIARAMGTLLLQCMAGNALTLRQITIPYRLTEEDKLSNADELRIRHGSLNARHEFGVQK